MAAAVLSAPRTDVDGVGKRSFSRVDGIASTSASASRTYPGELAYFLPVPIHTLARNTPASSLECIEEEERLCCAGSEKGARATCTRGVVTEL